MTVEESYTLDDSDGRLRPAIGKLIFLLRLPLILLFAVATGLFFCGRRCSCGRTPASRR
jgi:hypothetical protein